MSALYHPLTLPSGIVAGNLFLAPLAGYTDLAFRALAREEGADFTFTEMISAEAIRRGNQKTFRLATRAPNEGTYGIQIFAGNEQSAAAAVRALASYRPLLFDLNCGCSMPKILKSGAGARLMQSPAVIGEIVRAMAEASPVPISVKLRLGWDADSVTYLDAAEAAVKNGACLVTLHPRTRAQGFSGRADWTCLRTLKLAVPCPVVGSGDLFTAADAHALLENTGCDGVMFARGAIGNPFIFREARALLLGEAPPPARSAAERLDLALRHLRLLGSYKSELVAAREMRKHFARYTAGLERAAQLRRAVNAARTFREYEEIVSRYQGGTLPE